MDGERERVDGVRGQLHDVEDAVLVGVAGASGHVHQTRQENRTAGA